MFGLWRKHPRQGIIDGLHARIVAQSRSPELYQALGMPDTVEGRFESLTLHALLVLRRLRALPDPAGDVAQDLVDSVFSHLEINLRELGVGDFGVPKRIKKLARAFYDRTHVYDGLLDGGEPAALAAEIGRRVETAPEPLVGFAAYLLASETSLALQDLSGLIGELHFADPAAASAEEAVA